MLDHQLGHDQPARLGGGVGVVRAVNLEDAGAGHDALGFGGIAGTSAGIAQILFFIFLAFLVISLIAGLVRRA